MKTVPLADNFLVLIILAANSNPVDFCTHLRTIENAPLKSNGKIKMVTPVPSELFGFPSKCGPDHQGHLSRKLEQKSCSCNLQNEAQSYLAIAFPKSCLIYYKVECSMYKTRSDSACWLFMKKSKWQLDMQWICDSSENEDAKCQNQNTAFSVQVLHQSQIYLASRCSNSLKMMKCSLLTCPIPLSGRTNR